MSPQRQTFSSLAQSYVLTLSACFTEEIVQAIEVLASELRNSWKDQRQVFICGNGGSAANALHMANDLHYGIGACGHGPQISGLRVEALPANVGIISCLANDIGYANVFAHQLQVKANNQDILIVLSGSGNSPNVVNALKTASSLGMKSFAIVAYNGGKCKELADFPIHFAINDMQIAEDTQLVVGHLCMQWLSSHKPSEVEY